MKLAQALADLISLIVNGCLSSVTWFAVRYACNVNTFYTLKVERIFIPFSIHRKFSPDLIKNDNGTPFAKAIGVESYRIIFVQLVRSISANEHKGKSYQERPKSRPSSCRASPQNKEHY
jgi:hypothetical protein